METVFERVKRVIAGVIAIDEKYIVPQAALIDDLGADSLDLVNMTVAVEEEFSGEGKTLKFSEEEAEQIRTVQDVLDFLAKNGIVDPPPVS